MLITREFLLAESVPQRLIEEMMRRSSREIYWATADDLSEIPQVAPWYEEWMIALCQYDPLLDRTLDDSISRGGPIDPELMAKVAAQDRCVTDERFEARRAYIESLKQDRVRGR